ncbi:hypothetical protein CLOP_g22307 [Closterium sp. NIES-67]|nr:hypothetical protein CLOP_g22307 [Closterium sp. NIES-67]
MPRPGESAPRTVTLLPGDGIGPLVTDAVVQVLSAMRAPVQFEVCEVSGRMPRLPADVLDSLRRNGVGIKGGLATPVGGGVSSLNMQLRKELDLFANLVFCHDMPIATSATNTTTTNNNNNHHAPATPPPHAHADGNTHDGARDHVRAHARGDVAAALRRRHTGVNIVVIRENTEGEYSGLEHEVVPGVVESLKVVSKFCSERIARYAFQYAYLNGRKAVTAVHKANVMKVSDGLFLESCRQMALAYPQIRYSEVIVDNCCMQLVRRPQQFDVMVTPNLYGSLVANTAAGICGGSYLMPGGNVGYNAAVFEQGASAGNVGNERMVAERTANPTALLLSAAMMLRHLQVPVFADRVEGAVKAMLAEGAVLTPDMGGRATTQDMVDAIVDKLG